MTLGNEDTELEVSEIVRNTVSHISLDGNGNITTGGDVNLSGNFIDDVRVVNNNGKLDITTYTTDSIDIRPNNTTGLEVQSGGVVSVPNGDITDGTNVIYDQSASHIPSSIVQTAGLDADTVDGFEAADIRTSSNVAQLTSTNTTLDINQSTWTDIPFDVQDILDDAYTHDASSTPAEITFDEAGKYRVNVSLAYDSNGNIRINPGIKFNINGTRLDTQGLTGYVRDGSGHNEGSNTVSRVIDVNAGDTLKIQTIEQGNAGTVTMRANESVLTIEQLSASAAKVSDADTLDGLDSTAFVKTDGSTPITSSQAINQSSGNDYLKFNNTTTGDTWDFHVATDASLDLEVNNTDAMSIDASSQQATFSSRVYGESGFDAGGASVDNVSEANTTGSGSASFDVYDSANGQALARFNEGGNVEIPNGSLSVSDAAGSDFVAESGDSMTGRLSMDGNDIYFQPDSDGGSVTALTFESNTNAGSDYGYIKYHDNYWGGGEGSALRLQAENDDGSSGPDSIVMSGQGGAIVDTNALKVQNVDIEDVGSDGNTINQTIYDASNNYIPQSALQNDTVTIEGNTIALGGSTAVNHNDLSSISSNDHHSKTSSASELTDVSADSVSDAHHSKYTDSNAISAVEGARFSELAFNNIENPGTTRSIGIDDSEGVLFKDSGGNTYPLWNSKYVSGGTDLSISGGSGSGSTPITISHDDTSTQGNVSAGAGEAITDINLDGRGHTTSISTTSFDSRYDNYGHWGLEDDDGNNTSIYSGNDVRIDSGTDITTNISSTGNYTEIDISHANTSGQGNVSTGGATVIDDINLDGRGHVTNLNTQNRSLDDWQSSVDDNTVGFGSNTDFSIFYESASDELVIRDETNNVDLIRQPKAGPTQFIQGADIGSIEAPEDSLTQTINAAVTSASTSGDTVGYTFAVDNQTGLQVSATSDGSGGLSSGPDVEIPNGDLEVGANSGGDVRISGELTEGATL